jgi:hypothetical protein
MGCIARNIDIQCSLLTPTEGGKSRPRERAREERRARTNIGYDVEGDVRAGMCRARRRARTEAPGPGRKGKFTTYGAGMQPTQARITIKEDQGHKLRLRQKGKIKWRAER